MNFDFILDDNFRAILIRDFEELNKCLDAKASKSVLVLSGSIIESILTDYFTNYPVDKLDAASVLSMDLAELLNHAIEHNLISQSTKDLSTVIKNYRNLIHPGREIRKKEKFNHDTALVAKSLLNIILDEIKDNYLNNLGRTAIEIISKLENDAISIPTFEIITKKLHKNEKIRLFNYLIEYDSNAINYPSQLTEPKKYIITLKTKVDRSTIIYQLNKIVTKIEIGEKWEVIKYFYLLYEEINFLDDDSQELIVLYILNVLIESISSVKELERYIDRQLFAIVGNFIITDTVK